MEGRRTDKRGSVTASSSRFTASSAAEHGAGLLHRAVQGETPFAAVGRPRPLGVNLLLSLAESAVIYGLCNEVPRQRPAWHVRPRSHSSVR